MTRDRAVDYQRMQPLGIEGAYLFTPHVHADHRGSLFESFQGGALKEIVGHRFRVAQVNCVESRKGAIRGVHFADVPPGQAKYVTCVAGVAFDVVVDVRIGSPTFGHWRGVVLDDNTHRSLYLAEGLGHALLALSDKAVVYYMCSQPFTPGRERGINPFDTQIGICWPGGADFILSDRDTAAPSLEEAMAAGILPSYLACRAFNAEPDTARPPSPESRKPNPADWAPASMGNAACREPLQSGSGSRPA